MKIERFLLENQFLCDIFILVIVEGKIKTINTIFFFNFMEHESEIYLSKYFLLPLPF